MSSMIWIIVLLIGVLMGAVGAWYCVKGFHGKHYRQFFPALCLTGITAAVWSLSQLIG